MSPRRVMAAPNLDVSVLIAAYPDVVLNAFFDPAALASWWQVTHSVTVPRTLGPYAIQWAPTGYRDDVLGRLGGVFRGTVIQFEAAHGFFVADAYWLPPDGEPIGPMALAVELTVVSRQPETRVRVAQSGFDENARWRRYYEVATVGWERALASLKSLLEE